MWYIYYVHIIFPWNGLTWCKSLFSKPFTLVFIFKSIIWIDLFTGNVLLAILVENKLNYCDVDSFEKRMKFASFENSYKFEAFHKPNIAKRRIAKFSAIYLRRLQIPCMYE